MARLRLFLLLFVITIPITSFAQVPTPVTNPGWCGITSLTAVQWYDGFWWHQNAKTRMTCSGQFYGSVSAQLYLEQPGAMSGTFYSTGTYGEVHKSWPYTQHTCYTGPFDSIPVCTDTQIAIPPSVTLETNVLSASQIYRAIALISWEVGPASCTPYGCTPNVLKRSAATPWQGAPEQY